MTLLRRPWAALALALTVVLAPFVAASPSSASSYAPITGEGSTWASDALDLWRTHVASSGIEVDYAATGSEAGLEGFGNGTDDFAFSDLPYGVADTAPPARGFTYVPAVGGGVALTYNLTVAGKRITDLRLSAPTIAAIFSGAITEWDDPAVAADNPRLALPAEPIHPVVRSDESATTLTFTHWLAAETPGAWNCGSTTLFTRCAAYDPTIQQAKTGDNGVVGFVGQQAGAIGYADAAYAQPFRLPEVAVENAAGYYVPPTASNVAIALSKLTVAADRTPDVDAVYTSTDPRTYPLVHYAYAVIPTAATDASMTPQKRQALADLLDFGLCEAQQSAFSVGDAPLPLNLVRVGLEQIRRLGPTADGGPVDGVDIPDTSAALAACANPTFDPATLTDTLTRDALMPQACQKVGALPCWINPPVNTRAPEISGVINVGGLMSADPGIWTGAASFSYAWLAGGIAIHGAVWPNFRVPASAVGKRLSVRVTAHSPDGSTTTRTSAAFTVPRGRLFASDLRVAGLPRVGRTVRLLGSITPSATLHLQWYAGGRPIRGATSRTWRIRRAQLGKPLAVKVRATKVAYVTLIKTTPRTRPVRPA